MVILTFLFLHNYHLHNDVYVPPQEFAFYIEYTLILEVFPIMLILSIIDKSDLRFFLREFLFLRTLLRNNQYNDPKTNDPSYNKWKRGEGVFAIIS